jgi:DNA-binding transcriptional MocR family regulator
VPRAVDLRQLRQALAARAIDIEDASVAFAETSPLHGFRVSYAHAPMDDVRRALLAVAQELERQLQHPLERAGGDTRAARAVSG